MEKKQVFSIRKLKNGAASIAIATVLFGVNTNQVSASETAAMDPTVVVEPEATKEVASSLSEEPIEEPVEELTEGALEGPTAADSSLNSSAEGALTAEATVLSEPTRAESIATPSAKAPLTEASLAASAAIDSEAVTASSEETPLAAATETEKVDEVPAETEKIAAKLATSELKLGAEPTVLRAVDAAVAANTTAEETVTPNIVRYDGQNREAVAVNVAKAHFSTSPKVIIVNRDKFPDAISATNISQGQYPVLYTKAGSVDQETIALLKTMTLNEIYILGGAVSVNDSVVAQLQQATGVSVTRVGGKDRYEANVNAIKLQYDQKEHVVIASGEIYTDALYGVSYANTIDSPVVLTKRDRLETATIDLLKTLGVKQASLIGGPLTLTASVETQLQNLGIIVNRIAGANRYSGSAEVAKAAYPNPKTVVVASGEVFSDALVSAPLAQKLDAPILLVKQNSLDPAVSQYLSGKKVTIKNIYIQGGPLTIAATNQEAIKKATTYVVVTNKLPFTTVTQQDNTLPSGQTKVIQAGVDGHETVTYDLVYSNGVSVGRIETGRTTIAPVDEIILVGMNKQQIANIGNITIEELSLDAGSLYQGYNGRDITLRMVATSTMGPISNAYVNYNSMYGHFERFEFVNMGNNIFEATIPLSSFYITAGLYRIGLIGIVDEDRPWAVFPTGKGSGFDYTSADLSAGDFTII